MAEGDVKQIPKKGYLATPGKCRGLSVNGGSSIAWWFIDVYSGNPTKMDDLGVPPF